MDELIGQLVTALRERPRVTAGRDPTPSAACIDSPAVKTTELGGPERGDDGGKKINGRKRHLLVDTLGFWLAVLMTSAGLDDGVAAPRLLGHITGSPDLRAGMAMHVRFDHLADGVVLPNWEPAPSPAP